MRSIAKLSLQNFVAYKKLYIKIICALIALLFLITLICSFTLSVNAKQNEMLCQYVSANYVFGNRPLGYGEVKERFQTSEVHRVSDAAILKEVFGVESSNLPIRTQNFALYSDGQRHVFCKEFDQFVQIYADTNNFFTQNDYGEGGKNAEFLLGRLPQNATEVALSEKFLECYGLSRDVFGKDVTLTAVKRVLKEGWTGWYSDDAFEYVDLSLKVQFTVCGIISKEYTDLKGHGHFCPDICVSLDSELALFGVEKQYLCSFDEWPCRETVKYLSGSELLYEGKTYCERIEAAKNLQLVVKQLMLYFGAAMVFGIVFTLALLCEKLCSAQTKNSGVLLMSGLTGGKLFCVWLLQLAFASLIALIISSGMSFGMMCLISEVIVRTYGWSLAVSAATFCQITAIGFVAIAVITVTALGYFAFVFRRRNTRELLDV